ncbi:hypothetical protein CL629_03820 [bacterium]|nr:hypothetical protein [bacterium]|tara:strand:+ start:619 stop:2466 length:1848 start_codon:yes stop_codon:yes gene_type:complete
MRAHTKEGIRGALALQLIVALIGLFVPIGTYGETQAAVTYLQSKDPNPWVTMALITAGEEASVEYLKGTTGDKALDFEAPILAISAKGEDPRTFPNINLVEELKSYHIDSQIGDASLVNDDIFGVLALTAAGEDVSDEIIEDAKTFILNNQKEDGSWSYGVDSESGDTNTTSAGIMALIAVGTSKGSTEIQNALDYLREAQNEDAGFPYDPQSTWGTNSDASSDAWVISALYSAEEDISSWAKDGITPIDHLESLQTTEGYFENQTGAGETSFTPTETAYALVALLNKSYPVAVFEAEEPLVTYRIEGSVETFCSGEMRVENPLVLIEEVAEECGFTYEIEEFSFGPYLKRIGDDEAEGFIGWLYAVNLELPSVGAADYALEENDSILWHYGESEEPYMRVSISDEEVDIGESVTATVEYFEEEAWTLLEGAEVNVGDDTYTTGEDGVVSFTPTSGYFEVFAEKEGYVRSETQELIVGETHELNIPLEVTIEEDAGGGGGGTNGSASSPSVAFSVTNSADGEPEFVFPSVNTGEALQESVSLQNNGTSKLYLESIVTGDELFRENLTIDEGSWRRFSTALLAGGTKDAEVGLTIPQSTSAGAKTGNLVFWAIQTQ